MLHLCKRQHTFFFCCAYAIVLFYTVFLARRRHALHERFNRKLVNLRPLIGKTSSFFYYVRLGHTNQLGNLLTDVVGNIALFVPLPICIFWRLGKIKLTTAVIVGLILSTVIEVAQFTLGLGVADIDDIIFNTLGSFIGYKIAHILFVQNHLAYKVSELDNLNHE